MGTGNLDAHGEEIGEKARPYAGGLEVALHGEPSGAVPVRTYL